MIGQIVYVKGHAESEKQAQQAYKSFKNYKWDVELSVGLVAKDVDDSSIKIVEDSRLLNFKQENRRRYLTKLACALNHVKFWEKVVDANTPMAFLEHDAVCTQPYTHYDFQDYLILNAEFVFRPPNKLGLQQFKDFNWPSFGVCDLPENYPLSYYRNNVWKDSFMAPGTGAYIISPSGAKKMLNAVEKYGIDQSDFMINSKNLRIQYINPSPVKFNKVNLSTSYGF